MPFKSTRFLGAEEKEAVIKDWMNFMKNGFGREYFTKRLYDHLHLHCSFIAHFNINGFYDSYFENPENTMKFLSQFDNDYGYRSIEYGTTYWFTNEDYHDINSAMIESYEPHKEKIYTGLKLKTKKMKLRQIEQLKKEIWEID